MAKFINTNPLKFNPNTPFSVYTKSTEYVAGQGNTTTWNRLDSDGYKVFYGQWQTTHGDRAIAAESLGIKESASIRTFYNPNIYNLINREHTIIVKNADETAFVDGKPNKNNPNLYELWGGVDNVTEENQFMEFRVRRYEGI